MFGKVELGGVDIEGSDTGSTSCFREGASEKADRAGAEDEDGLAFGESDPACSMDDHGERLGEGSLFVCAVIRETGSDKQQKRRNRSANEWLK